ncbi:MAG: LAGLIDADG family homing endonuclease [Candidatus Woesearchaeota archaeon]
MNRTENYLKWISNRNRKVALSRWRNIENRITSGIKAKEKYEEYKLLKAKILGFLAGDGHVSIRKERKSLHHEIEFYPDRENLAHQFTAAFNALYGQMPAIKIRKNFFAVRIASKAACKDLLTTAKFGVLNWRVPFSYLRSPKQQTEWLRAYYDCEAYVDKTKIVPQPVNKEGLLEVQKLLKRFNVESRIYEYKRKNKNWNTNYLLFIQKKKSRKVFLNKIGFNHPVKLEKLRLSLAD